MAALHLDAAPTSPSDSSSAWPPAGAHGCTASPSLEDVRSHSHHTRVALATLTAAARRSDSGGSGPQGRLLTWQLGWVQEAVDGVQVEVYLLPLVAHRHLAAAAVCG